ncbi:MAG: DUF4062 domain-containing protein [Campylobacterota bacterium]|nr:DUF4062 domain-containing protein [Campylobacterota bacterium]
MTNNSKTFRLFLSSTFNDMRAERDALQATVFPRLRAYCDEHGFSFSPIDLRWGVSSEAGDDQKTMQICIDEVQRCKNALNPHFAIMLGERYGWIPLPAKVEANEFELVKNAVLTKFKDDAKVKEYIELWYKKDTNNLPAQYMLQAKIKDEHKDWDYWGDVENSLRNAFKSVVEGELKDTLDEDTKSKYIKSATEQEIVEGLFHNGEVAQKNIYYYSRNFTNIDTMKAEDFATLEAKDKEYRKTDPAYQITVKHFSDFKNFTEDKLDENIRPFHQKLQNKIKESIPKENYKEYNLKLDTTLERTQDSVTKTHLKEFCEDFHDTIFKSMQEEIQNFKAQDIQDRELSEQEDFMEEKSKIFVGREDFLKKVDSYIESENSNAPLVIYADSGSGKSALMAKLTQNVKEKNSLEGTDVIYRFVGTSELSNTPINLYKSLYTQLTQNLDLQNICTTYMDENEINVDSIQSDIKELNKVLSHLIQNYPADKKLVLFIDALDQFMLNDSLDWLPRTLNNNTKIIISTLPDSYEGIQYLPKLKQKFKNFEDNFMFLEAFNDDEASSMIDEYLASRERTLTAEQKDKILQAFIQSGSPLYLKIVLEEAFEWKSYTEVKNEKYPKELDELIARLFKRLNTHSHHSLPVIRYAFSYIACSKDGLPEPELFDILSQEKEIMDDVSNQFYPRPQRIPTAVWARLYSEMSQYLSIKEVDGMDQISFFHRKFNEGAYKLLGSKEKAHSNLAEFYTLVYEQNEEILQEKNIGATLESALTELPYQLIMSKQKKESLELLTNFEFLMKKFKLNKTQEVMEDYALAKAEGMNDK